MLTDNYCLSDSSPCHIFAKTGIKSELYHCDKTLTLVYSAMKQ